MSWWSVVAVLLFAVVVLPGAVKGHPADDMPVDTDATEPTATTDGDQADSSLGDSAAKLKAVKVEYAVGDLLKRVAEQKSVSTASARRFLLKDLTQAAGPSCAEVFVAKNVRFDRPSGGDPGKGYTARGSSLAMWQNDTLVVTHEAAGHKRIRKRLAQFRQYGFVRVRARAIVISGPTEVVDTMVTDWSVVPTDLAGFATHAAGEIVPSTASSSDSPIQQVGHITESIQKSRPVLLKIVDEAALTTLREKAQSHAKMNIRHMQVASPWNGDEWRIRDCVVRPFVVGFDKGKPQIRQFADGLTINVRPEIQDNGILLTCAVEVSEITGVQTEPLSQTINGESVSVQVPETRTMCLNSQVRTQPGQALVIGGLKWKDGEQREESLLVLIQAERNVRDSNQANATAATEQEDAQDVSEINSGGANAYHSLYSPPVSPKAWKGLSGQGVKTKGGANGDLVQVEDATASSVKRELANTQTDVVRRVAAEKIRLRRAIAWANNGADAAMLERLRQKVSFKFNRTSFADAIREIAIDCEVNITVDRDSIEGNGVEDLAPVSMEVNGVSLKTAIGLLCEQQNLAFNWGNNVIRIFKLLPEQARFTVRNYPVADLVVPIPGSVPTEEFAEPHPVDFSGLVELNKTTIEPNTWVDGTGTIGPNENTLSLVVRQTDDVHEQVMELLIQLRELQDVQISTEYRVIQFNTPEQLQWLEDHVTFQQRPGRHSWALLPLDRDSGEGFPLDGHGKTLSAPKITTFVGQEASLEVGGGNDFKLTLTSGARPLKGDRLLELSYAVPRETDRRSMQPQPLVTQIIGNGQTLLLDVTETAKSVGRRFLDSSLPQAERIKAEWEQNERIKLAKKRRGRIIVAITPRIIWQEEEEELILGTP